MQFNEMNLLPGLVDALKDKGYDIPTPIQEKAIPILLNEKDIFGCAQTGTGKTAAFALPVLQLLSKKEIQKGHKKNIRALILAPTRELAIQIHENMLALGKFLPHSQTLIFGGVSQVAQVASLKKGTDILIATPGRLLDLMNQGHIRLDKIEYFVLDEADRMLDMGFINDIRKIIAKLPAKKQSLFFSATVSPEIMSLANSFLVSPEKISVTPPSSASKLIEQSVYFVEKEKKRELLKFLIVEEKIDHALVFTRTKRGADRVAKDLNKNGIPSDSIHGDKSQNARERALKGFKNRKIKILVATDIASRGIDVAGLSHVINYEIPEQAEVYVHRIGRTGRAGIEGTAFSLCTEDEKDYWKDINKLLKKPIRAVEEHPYSTPSTNNKKLINHSSNTSNHKLKQNEKRNSKILQHK